MVVSVVKNGTKHDNSSELQRYNELPHTSILNITGKQLFDAEQGQGAAAIDTRAVPIIDINWVTVTRLYRFKDKQSPHSTSRSPSREEVKIVALPSFSVDRVHNGRRTGSPSSTFLLYSNKYTYKRYLYLDNTPSTGTESLLKTRQSRHIFSLASPTR